MNLWWILIGCILIAIVFFAGKYSSKIGNELEKKNEEAEKKNALTRELDFKTYVKDGIIGIHAMGKKVVYLKNINDTYIILEFPFTNIHTFELMMDEEVIFKRILKPGQYDEATAAEIEGVMERHLEEYKKLRGDVMTVDIRLSVTNANNPTYLFNFYTKNVVPNKALLELAMTTSEAWGVQLVRDVELLRKA